MTIAQRAYVVDSILARQSREYRSVQNAARQAFQASMERAICQDLRSLLPGASTSADNMEGKIMRHAEALAKLPEHKEFTKGTHGVASMPSKLPMYVQDVPA
jgi:hypothetical protein